MVYGILKRRCVLASLAAVWGLSANSTRAADSDPPRVAVVAPVIVPLTTEDRIRDASSRLSLATEAAEREKRAFRSAKEAAIARIEALPDYQRARGDLETARVALNEARASRDEARLKARMAEVVAAWNKVWTSHPPLDADKELMVAKKKLEGVTADLAAAAKRLETEFALAQREREAALQLVKAMDERDRARAMAAHEAAAARQRLAAAQSEDAIRSLGDLAEIIRRAAMFPGDVLLGGAMPR